jgi:hypothetical protein
VSYLSITRRACATQFTAYMRSHPLLSDADVLGQIVGVSKLGHVCMSTNSSDTAKRVIALRDDR